MRARPLGFCFGGGGAGPPLPPRSRGRSGEAHAPCSSLPPAQFPSTYTPGRELPLNQLTELLRGEAAMAGYTEVLTW